MEVFPPTSILRVHRSWAVNMNFVSEVTNSTVVIDNEKIPVSKSYKKDLQSILEN